MTKAITIFVSHLFLYPILPFMMPMGTMEVSHLFGILNLDHWNLFEPALARLDWHKPSSVLECQLEAINAVGVNSVWARDLGFVIWDFISLRQFLNSSILKFLNLDSNSLTP